MAAGKTAFVTGGTGFLGMNLVEQLHEAGWSVTVAHRATSNLTGLQRFPVQFAVSDLLDLEAMTAAVPEGVDAVFHVAGNISMWDRRAEEQMRDNLGGTECVLEAARAKGAKRFVYTSSWATYGLGDRALSEESEQLGAESPRAYARSKYLAEQAVKAAVGQGLPGVIINPPHIVGRYDRSGWGRTVRMVKQGKSPAPPGAGCFCHAVEVAKAHIAAAERGQAGENYLLGGVNATFEEVFAVIAALVGKRPPRVAPAWAVRAMGRAGVLVASVTGKEPELTPAGAFIVTSRPSVVSDKAARELGFQAVDLTTMFTDARDWMASEGLL